jgi:hypothetical protein
MKFICGFKSHFVQWLQKIYVSFETENADSQTVTTTGLAAVTATLAIYKNIFKSTPATL